MGANKINWSARRDGVKPFSADASVGSTLTLLGETQGPQMMFDTSGGLKQRYSGDGGAFSFAQMGFDLSGQEKVVSPFTENPFVRAGVKAFSNGMNRLKLEVWDGDPDDEGSKRVKDGPLQKLLKSPNSRQTQKQLIKAHTTSMKLWGESGWFLADKQGRPVATSASGQLLRVPAQIIQVPGNRMQVEHDDRGWIKTYRYTVRTGSASSEAFPAASVIHFTDYDPDDPTRGFGDAECAVRPIDLQHQILRYLDASLRNGGAPAGMLIFPNGMTPEELERRQAESDDDLNVDNAKRIKVVDSDAKFVPNNMSPKDFEYGDLWDGMTTAILSALGVSGPVVGIYENATYQNVQTAFIELWRGTNGVLSLAADMADVITGILIPRLRGVWPRTRGYVVRFDHSAIEVLQDDKINELTLAREIANSGFGMSFNEALAMLSVTVEHQESGDRHMIAQGLTDADTKEVFGPKQNEAVTKKALAAAFRKYHHEIQCARETAE